MPSTRSLRRACRLVAATLIILTVVPVQAATFAVPDDATLIRTTPTIVIASAQSSRVEKNADGQIETITTFYIQETLKGRVPDIFEVIERGGRLEREALIIPGSPRYAIGARYVLFLIGSKRGWHTRDLIMGKFSFRTDALGRDLLVRDEKEFFGISSRGGRHYERRRMREPFLDFIRTVSRGGPARKQYELSADAVSTPLLPEDDGVNRGLIPVANGTFSPTTYTYPILDPEGGRWNIFPAPVAFTSVGTMPGAPGGGIDAINAAFASWNNDPSSNINYLYAGADPGTHPNGLSAPDNGNTINFTRSQGPGTTFSCSGGGYSGLLGNGGIVAISGTHTGPNSETFATISEVDVEMNPQIANCTLLLNSGDWNTAVAHEVGHTLGLRHSDQDRAGGACPGTIDCSNSAVMKAFITGGINAALQPWDQSAVAALYTGAGTPAPASPTGVAATAQSATVIRVTWNTVATATSYQIFRKGPGAGGFTLHTTQPAPPYDDAVLANSSYQYRVRAVNAGGASPDSAADLATTVIFTDDPLTAGVPVKAIHLSQLRTAVNAVRALAGLSPPATFTDAASPGVVVRALHVTQLRARLDEALTILGLPTGGYTDAVTTGTPIKAIHFQEIRNRVK